VFCQEVEKEDLDFGLRKLDTNPLFFEDIDNSKFDMISEIKEDESPERSYLESYTKKEEINFDCDYSSINLDISRNTIFWTENTKILNDFEKDDNFIIKSERNANENSFFLLKFLINYFFFEEDHKKKNLILNLEEINDVDEGSTPMTTQSSLKRISFFQVIYFIHA